MRRTVAAAAVLVLAATPAWAGEGTTLGIPDGWWKLLNLIAFIFVLVWFVGRPLGRFLDARRREIGHGFEEAREKLRQAEELNAEVKKRLAEVEQELAELRARAEREGAAEAERIAEAARAEEERFLRRVDEQITRRTAETRQRLAEDTVELTAQLARELLARKITDEDRKRLLKKSLDAMRSVEEGA